MLLQYRPLRWSSAATKKKSIKIHPLTRNIQMLVVSVTWPLGPGTAVLSSSTFGSHSRAAGCKMVRILNQTKKLLRKYHLPAAYEIRQA